MEEALSARDTTDEMLKWSIDIPLATNPYMVKLVALCFVGGAVLGWSFLAVALCTDGQWLLAAQTLVAFVGIGIALTVFGIVVMLVVYGNRLPTTYVVTECGIRCEYDDSRTRQLAMTILGVAAMSGAPAQTVAPLAVADSRANELLFADSCKVDIDQRRMVIGFRKGLRPVLRVHCLSANFDQVVDIVRTKMGPRCFTSPPSSHASAGPS